MTDIYQRRIKKVQKLLAEQRQPAALFISSAPAVQCSRDQLYPYRQNSNFFYLTGCRSEGLALLISTEKKKPVLFSVPAGKMQGVWTDKSSSPNETASALNATLTVTEDVAKEAVRQLKGTEILFFQNDEKTAGWQAAQILLQEPSHMRRGLPSRFFHSDLIFERLRLYKEPEELLLIRKAAEATNVALLSTVLDTLAGRSEKEISATLSYYFSLQGCQPAFATIVAAGKSAAILHHEPSNRLLRSNDLLLFDCGAEHEMYASDISRVVPVGRKFKEWQRDLYGIVLEAQLAAISKVRSGVLIRSVYDAAAKVLLAGLVELKVLRGRSSALLHNQAYKPYFPHGIGHGLGLDTHDIGNLRGNNAARLESGMVITIEPGLYFPKAVGDVNLPCGVRIEDDLLVTGNGSEILSAGFPKEIDELEQVLAG